MTYMELLRRVLDIQLQEKDCRRLASFIATLIEILSRISGVGYEAICDEMKLSIGYVREEIEKELP